MRAIAGLVALGLALSANLVSFREAAAARGVEIGLLECFIEEGGAFVVGSNRAVSCTFYPASGVPENYLGSIRRFGLDIGYTKQALMKWAVLAASADRYQSGSLAGKYVGASANASFAIGLGANALIGGSRDSIALQPLSLQTQKGVNIAFGVAQLELETVGGR